MLIGRIWEVTVSTHGFALEQDCLSGFADAVVQLILVVGVQSINTEAFEIWYNISMNSTEPYTRETL